jgi:hypothetical protein
MIRNRCGQDWFKDFGFGLCGPYQCHCEAKHEVIIAPLRSGHCEENPSQPREILCLLRRRASHRSGLSRERACIALRQCLTAISWIWSTNAWTWDYFQYAYRNGWGYQYQSDYSLALVVAYILAYALGCVAYLVSWRWINPLLAGVGLVVCGFGVLSFCIEGSHWLWDHHLSWILSCPAAALIVGAVAVVQLVRERRNLARETPGLEQV